VTTGFLAGISVHIFISQLPGILGLPSPDGPMLQRLAVLATHLGQTNPFTLAIGLGVLGTIALSERIDARIPGALIGLAAASVAVLWLGLESRGVSVLGAISVAPPSFAIPVISAGRLASLLSLSLIVSVVIMVQTAATTRSFLSDPDQPPDVDRDFVGVGVGSILSGLIGAFPVDASPPRTGVVSETGGRSQIAGLAAVVIIFVLLAFGASLLSRIPNAALGGVLLFVALRIVRVGQIVAIARQSFGEFLLIAATAAAIIILPIEQGVGIGIALSLLYGIWSTTRARVLVYERVSGTSIWWPSSHNIPGEREPNVIVAGFQAPLSFLNAYHFRRDILTALQASPQRVRLIVLEATGIVEIDFTAAQVLADLIRKCHADGIDFAVARLESIRAQDAMARFGIDDLLGPARSFQSVEEAIQALRKKAQAGNQRRPVGPQSS
jgi:MFS superfamily sulfate permease-like transporter